MKQEHYIKFPTETPPTEVGYYIAMRLDGGWHELYWSGKAWKQWEGREDRKDYHDVTHWLKPYTEVLQEAQVSDVPVGEGMIHLTKEEHRQQIINAYKAGQEFGESDAIQDYEIPPTIDEHLQALNSNNQPVEGTGYHDLLRYKSPHKH